MNECLQEHDRYTFSVEIPQSIPVSALAVGCVSIVSLLRIFCGCHWAKYINNNDSNIRAAFL